MNVFFPLLQPEVGLEVTCGPWEAGGGAVSATGRSGSRFVFLRSSDQLLRGVHDSKKMKHLWLRKERGTITRHVVVFKTGLYQMHLEHLPPIR